jgi:hypothetical protein
MTTTTTRKATVGTCLACGVRTARADLKDGSLIEAEVGNLTAAAELRAHAAGVPTYRVVWRNAIQLDQRTTRDIRVNPAGFDGSRIWKAHTCTTTPTAPDDTTEVGA